eukprot:scaffold20312_cov185-Amphora_coffeaeformis.AAC.8
MHYLARPARDIDARLKSLTKQVSSTPKGRGDSPVSNGLDLKQNCDPVYGVKYEVCMYHTVCAIPRCPAEKTPALVNDQLQYYYYYYKSTSHHQRRGKTPKTKKSDDISPHNNNNNKRTVHIDRGLDLLLRYVIAR